MEHFIYLSIIHILCSYVCILKIKHSNKSKWVLFIFPEIFHTYILLVYGLNGYCGNWNISLQKVETFVNRVKMENENDTTL